MARNDPQMNLRVPMELKEKIEKSAFDSGRSINAEAVFRLEQSFTQDKKLLEISSVMTKTMMNSLEAMDTALSKIVHLQDELDEKTKLLNKLSKKSDED